MAAGPGRTAGCASLSAPRRAPRPGFYVSVPPKRGGRFFPQTLKPSQGCRRCPLRMARVLDEAWAAPTTRLGIRPPP